VGVVAYFVNGAEWAPSRDTLYRFPHGGTVFIPLSSDDDIVFTSPAGDRVAFDYPDLDTVQVTAGEARGDGELDGLLGTFDSGMAQKGDFAPRAEALATWRRERADSVLADEPQWMRTRTACTPAAPAGSTSGRTTRRSRVRSACRTPTSPRAARCSSAEGPGPSRSGPAAATCGWAASGS
jgi:hypothetical protein